jgi:PAS domain S-box-containing protein
LLLGPVLGTASYFLYPPGWARLYFINAGQTLASLIAWLLLRRLTRTGASDPALLPFWRSLTAGALAWLSGNLCFLTLQLGFDLTSFPGWQDLFFLPAYVLMFAGLLRLPQPERAASARINTLIEAAALFLATLLVGWHFRLHEAMLGFLQAPSLPSGYPLLYPVLDIALLWQLSVRTRDQSDSSLRGGALSWLVGGVFMLVMADFSMPDILVKSPLQGGGSLSDLGWGYFSSAWGLAALLQARHPAPAPDSSHPFRSRKLVMLFVIYGWVLGMVLLLLDGLFTAGSGRQSMLLAAGVVAVLLLIIIRQVREVSSNEHLNRLVAELEESRGQFQLLFTLFPDATQLSRLGDGRLVEVNEGFSRVFGYSYREAVGRSSHDLGLWVEPTDRTELAGVLGREGRIHQRETRFRRRDGTVFPAELTARLIDLQDGRYVLSLIRDLSEKKTAEEQLRRNEAELRRAQKLEAIGGLAGGIAHDVNNMLTPIMGGTEMTLLDLPVGHPARPALQQVLDASRRARDMVRQILTFSRRTETQAQQVELGPIIQEVVRQLRPRLPAGAQIQHVRRAPPPLLGDATQLHQVILNLCTNAVLALPGRPDDRIEIIEESLQVGEPSAPGLSGFRAGTYLHLSVRDTGCGMTAAVLERIFEPFFTTRRGGEGTGLGLAVVHGIIQQHGGFIKVYSAPGEGSIFHVYLPAAAEAAEAGPGGGEAALPLGQGQEVVCIDDDVLVLDTLTGLLSRLGYTLRSFGAPAEAFAYLTGRDSARTAAVICDFTMPEQDGISLAQQVGRLRSGLPWILLSGYLSEETVQRARAAGLEHFVDKPPSLEQLARILQRLTRREATQIMLPLQPPR